MKTGKDRWICGCVIVLCLIALEGCKGTPLPADKQSYAGKWVNTHIVLQISMDGTVNYKKEEGKRKTTINAPIKEFQKDDFVVGVWFMTTTFEVQKPPFKEGNRWAMIVDGNKLFKVIETRGATEASVNAEKKILQGIRASNRDTV